MALLFLPASSYTQEKSEFELLSIAANMQFWLILDGLLLIVEFWR